MKKRFLGSGGLAFWMSLHLTALALLSGAAAWAESAGSSDIDSIPDITVTARKFAEQLQDTPIAITAFSNEALEARSISDISDIGKYVPNMVFNTTADIGALSGIGSIYIRGIGQDDFTMAIDPGVGIYVDGVYVARSVGDVLDIIDLGQVEVLRGPQGTLFGKNTIGGAINITSLKPGTEFASKASFEYGTYNQRNFTASMDAPIADNLLTKLSFGTRNADGYVQELNPGVPNPGGVDHVVGRVAIEYLPTDTLTFDLTIDGTRQRDSAAPNVLIAVNPNAAFALAYNKSVGSVCYPVVNTSNPLCYSSYYVVGPYDTSGTYTTANPYINDAIPLAMSPETHLDVWGTALNSQWNINSQLTIKSISAFRSSTAIYSRDEDESPVPLVQSVTKWRDQQISQEVQLLGTAFDNRMKWIVGGFYMKETGEFQDVVEFFELPILSGGNFDNVSVAGFGQAVYSITSGLSLTAGIRDTSDTKKYLPQQRILGPNQYDIPVGFSITPEILTTAKADAWTPYVNLSDKITDSALVYISYSEGFKGGGFTQRVFPPINYVPTFRPEFAKTYELGLKSEWFDKRLVLNNALFWTDYTDQQVLVDEGVAPTTQNAASSTIKGFEIEAEAVPVSNLTINSSVGMTYARYNKLDSTAIAAGLSLDSRFSNTPEFTVKAGPSYVYALGGVGTLTPRIDWSYSSGVFRDAANSPLLHQPAFDVVDGSLTYEDPKKLWTVSLIGKNLTNATYLISGQDQSSLSAGVGPAEGVYSRPRTITLKVTRVF